LVEGPAPVGVHFPSLFVIHPDGTGRRDLPAGGWANLGYDGLSMTYSDADGLHWFDINEGTVKLLTAAGKEAYHPLLSPDGASVAYMNTSEDPGLYIMPLDGSAPRKVPGTDAWVIPAGWMPDGRRLVITRLSGEGSLVEIVDVETGEAEKSFAIQNAKGGFPVLSPAGGRLAFSELGFGQSNYSVSVSALDGSDRRSIAVMAGGFMVEAGAWSPDGVWLVVIVTSYPDPMTPVHIPVLVRPDTCELAALPFQGLVRGWAA
jgi:Tol biopolymer transport system component